MDQVLHLDTDKAKIVSVTKNMDGNCSRNNHTATTFASFRTSNVT